MGEVWYRTEANNKEMDQLFDKRPKRGRGVNELNFAAPTLSLLAKYTKLREE